MKRCIFVLQDTTQLITNPNNEWTIILLMLLLLIGLYFLQKYMFLFDQKLVKTPDSKVQKPLKPWPLYAATLLGLLVFLYNVFSPHDLNFTDAAWSLFEGLIVICAGLTIVGLVTQSIMFFGIKHGILRAFIYLVLMTVYYYAGFVSGMLVIILLLIFILIFFIKYFKNLLTLK